MTDPLLCRTALRRRASPLLAAAHGWQGRLSHPTTPETPHRCTPVPLTTAHPTPRAIRVRRSPR
ncbi:hypothetical protein QFZ22_005876 [Streptomyces canus]|uniref:Uncharacterized protein n=1 Tax=Streptomyces canus TaxID=58343 RepID=A0AAW8FIC3_9ACTN|nr:hypothetical protein [Streptomyces canus]MDQ0909891.1 hypothetical protein [Streptomyces canus]